jgi:hypothetical protein
VVEESQSQVSRVLNKGVGPVRKQNKKKMKEKKKVEVEDE